MIEPPAPTIRLNEPDMMLICELENSIKQVFTVFERADHDENLKQPNARKIGDLSDRPSLAFDETLHPPFGDRSENVGDGVKTAHPVEQSRELAMRRVRGHRPPLPSGIRVVTIVPSVFT